MTPDVVPVARQVNEDLEAVSQRKERGKVQIVWMLDADADAKLWQGLQ